MTKKLYFSLSDNADLNGVIMELSGCMKYIETDMENLDPADAEETEYTLKPIWMTDKEFDNLPEYEG